MESPPRSKKLSWTPMPPMPSVSSHSRVTACSRSVRGATCGVVSRGRDASPAVPGLADASGAPAVSGAVRAPGASIQCRCRSKA